MLEDLADTVFVLARLGVAGVTVVFTAGLDVGEGEETLLYVVAGLDHLLERVASQVAGTV